MKEINPSSNPYLRNLSGPTRRTLLRRLPEVRTRQYEFVPAESEPNDLPV